MSARRADGPAAPAQPPSPIDDVIGALAGRLPAATRLNYVLMVGAAKQQLALRDEQARKPVDTAGYARSDEHPGYLYVNQRLEDMADEFGRVLNRADEEYDPRGPHDPHVERCFTILEFRDPSVLELFNTRADADLLREKGAYVILNWLMQKGANAQKALAREALQEAMYYDRGGRGRGQGAFGELLEVQGKLEDGERALGILAEPALSLPKPTQSEMSAFNEDVLYGNHGQKKPPKPADAVEPRKPRGSRNPLRDFGKPTTPNDEDQANRRFDDNSGKFPGGSGTRPSRMYDNQR